MSKLAFPGQTASDTRMPPVAALPQPANSERVIAPDATVFMQFSAEPTWETYDFLESYMKLRKSVLKRKDASPEIKTAN